MNVNDIVIILGAIGGLEGIKQLLRWWRFRRYDERKEDAAADAAEILNLQKIIESQASQIDTANTRLRERDQKVDTLYGELRKEQNANLEMLQKYHKLELEYTIKRCEKRGCGQREPPNNY